MDESFSLSLYIYIYILFLFSELKGEKRLQWWIFFILDLNGRDNRRLYRNAIKYMMGSGPFS